MINCKLETSVKKLFTFGNLFTYLPLLIILVPLLLQLLCCLSQLLFLLQPVLFSSNFCFFHAIVIIILPLGLLLYISSFYCDVLWVLESPNVACYATEDAVQIGNWFYLQLH
jgi:hypothetical protein